MDSQAKRAEIVAAAVATTLAMLAVLGACDALRGLISMAAGPGFGM